MGFVDGLRHLISDVSFIFGNLSPVSGRAGYAKGPDA